MSSSRGTHVPSSFLLGRRAGALLPLMTGTHARPPRAVVIVAANITDPIFVVGKKMPCSPSLAGTATSIRVTELAINWVFFTTLTAATRAPPDSSYVRKGITTARPSSRYRTPPY
ncbi:hypothetical protein PF005_g21437 [Phytophthora fragariae]|uniref:Uncharacterized protein n=1 Tax=Phytophthora fragariae TaxID=53985 RepID=A0A6A3QW16_9STRA|nr:hypothetical protein PF009_g20001 [Phytophthora fragariae]KAE9081994.1 hypothetical protein PF010_g21767 [Phytophthora fragariae]KAE9084484.1 hypothetical protein PF007_g21502 [Phytophthora fragariae]KAE9184999.1 hypothetical protein PF005_g21437 [Phytophthora fragariae]KAE9205419.1 hypothetical protein PF002_g20328 [Phytophthora fragariae]